MAASSRRSAGQPAVTASGASSPITTRAGRTPSRSTTSGVDEAPGRDAEREDRLEAGEHARQDGLVGQAGEQREAADVDQRVADADDAEQHDRRRLLGDGADEDQRRAEERDADAEPEREPAAPDEAEGEQRAEHPAGADGRGQDADARSRPCRRRSMATTTVKHASGSRA